MDVNRKIQLLEKLVESSKEIKNENSGDPFFKNWKNQVERTLFNIFGETSLEVTQFNTLEFAYRGYLIGNDDYVIAHRNAFKRSLDTALQSLNNYIEEFKEELKINPLPISTDLNNENKVEKIFISHSSEDKQIVEELIEILESIGLPSTRIFCTSFEGYGINYGENFFDKIKAELDTKVLVVFLLSHNFYNSPVCLCEMGATWIKTNFQIPILIPPFDFKDVKGVFPSTQGFKLNNSLALNQFKEQIENIFFIENKLNFSIWERKRDKIIARISTK